MAELTFNFDELRKKQLEVAKRFSEHVKAEMYARAPKESGFMASTIDVYEFTDGNSRPIEFKVGTNTGLEYPEIVEHFDWTGLASADFANVVKPTEDMPNTLWLALWKRGVMGETIPFARSTKFFTQDDVIPIAKEVFK